jgi:hypothetical protein
MSFVVFLPFFLKNIRFLIDDGEISGTVVAGGYQSFQLPRLVLVIGIVYIPHLLFVIFHYFGLAALLARIIEPELASKEAGVHFGQKTNMLLIDMYLTSREDISSKTLLLARKYKLSGLLEVEFVGGVDEPVVSLFDVDEDVVVGSQLRVEELAEVGHLQKVPVLVLFYLQLAPAFAAAQVQFVLLGL